ncbi:hypothetical protein DFP72DRAFT_1091775 [Ephemerocybe angulata]|uniref:Uncharacterized protein n=1 Tax=Ephemerocybe angulata TaxID=980116 RepID=A0A8H6HDR2_9AGAR|nr:hypothetical protein DFP72DRAFT_1091775 [Tulosesus angulatus]
MPPLVQDETWSSTPKHERSEALMILGIETAPRLAIFRNLSAAWSLQRYSMGTPLPCPCALEGRFCHKTPTTSEAPGIGPVPLIDINEARYRSKVRNCDHEYLIFKIGEKRSPRSTIGLLILKPRIEYTVVPFPLSCREMEMSPNLVLCIELLDLAWLAIAGDILRRIPSSVGEEFGKVGTGRPGKQAWASAVTETDKDKGDLGYRGA